MIVMDTGVLYAVVDRAEPAHRQVTTFLATNTEGLLTTPLVLAELDHLLATRLGEAVRSRVMMRLAADGVILSPFDADAFTMAAQVADEYADIRLGLTDASLMVAAARHGTTRILTVDHKHFRALRPLRGGPAFTLLPADAG
ncbi:MAG TPA: PIN domain-containing protein [Micromonosporaceae bacterium]|nr:PIN domain-containing protein [Micromonosporaceae bacterium]